MLNDDFDAFYRRYVRLAYAIALASVREATSAEDIVQVAFLRAWKHFGTLQCMEETGIRAWLAATTRNLSLNALRDQARRPLDSVVDIDLHAVPGTQGPSELKLDLERAIDDLPILDRELVLLRYVTGLSSQEIGEALAIPDGTVRRKLSEIREHLHVRLAPALGEVCPR